MAPFDFNFNFKFFISKNTRKVFDTIDKQNTIDKKNIHLQNYTSKVTEYGKDDS